MAPASPPPCDPPQSRRLLAPVRLCAILGALAFAPLAGQTQSIAAPPPDLVEVGVPDFVVLGTEALGLSSAPVDLQRLPDGRLVAAALRQIAIGDGTRWDVLSDAPGSGHADIESLMVGDDGALFSTTGDAVGLIRLDHEGRWWREIVKTFPRELEKRQPNLVYSARVAGAWYWFGTSGCITRWTAADKLHYLGSINTISSLFEAGGRAYASDAANGRLYRIDDDKLVPVLTATANSTDFAITGAAPFGDGRTLVATLNRGLLLFDGASLVPAPRPELLSAGRRLTALCALSADLFAAAVENFGLVVFDRTGRIVQVLDRTNDHRLSHIRQLRPGQPGELWALLRSGLAQIAIPSPFSRIEPLVETGFTFALPIRHQQRLWLCADGSALRGQYDAGRLARFQPDGPPGCYVFQLYPDVDGDTLLATTDQGLWALRAERWGRVADAPTGMHLLARRPGGDRWFYSAPGEIGWLHRDASGGYRLDRTPVPGLGDSFGGGCDQHEVAWIELGSGKCARVDLRAPTLKLESFGQEEGLGDSWVQIFFYRGEVRVVVGGRVLHHEDASGRFVLDEEFNRRFPSLFPSVVGRPVHDHSGRFWVMANNVVNVFDDSGPTPRRIELPTLTGLRPYYSVVQDDGVLWMHRNNVLVRYDPSFPSPPPRPLRALLGRVHLLADNRSLFPADGPLPPIPAHSNSVGVRFYATGAPLGATVTFETRFAGAQQEWASAGSAGSAVFNRLKEGAYQLQVRPRVGPLVGEEAHLAFTILPPWYRTTAAYAAYLTSLVVLVALIAWLASYLERREKRRLERVVAARTAELHESYRRLVAQVAETTRQAAERSASEDRYRRLSEELEVRVRERTAELESFAYSVSHDLRAPLRNISGFAELLNKHLLGRIDAGHARYLDLVTRESIRLGQLIDSLLAFSRLGRADLRISRCDLSAILTAVREELRPAVADREIDWRLAPLPLVEGDPTLLRQVFANLLGNAVKFTRGRNPALIEVGTLPAQAGAAEIVVFFRDNGAGFDPKYTDKLFGVFQRLHRATDFEGTGIGLANVRRIVLRHGGRVWAEGRSGQGATFYVALPQMPPARPLT